MEAQRFRADLYYRLAVVTLTVPPLRERREDIPELARGFLDRIRRQLGRPVTRFHPDAMEALHPPRLARERARAHQRDRAGGPSRSGERDPGERLSGGRKLGGVRGGAAADGARSPTASSTNSIGLSPRPARKCRPRSRRTTWSTSCRGCRGRVGEAARRSGVNERTLYAMMRRHGLRKEDFRGSSG